MISDAYLYAFDRLKLVWNINVMRVFIVCMIMILLAACQEDGRSSLPTQAVASTPVADLPVSSRSQFEQQVPTPVAESVIAEADAEYLLLTNIYERLARSVVNIEVVVNIAGQPGFVDVGRGSGFVYDLNGHIITNAHVVNDAEEILVTFEDGYVTEAELVGQDVYSDLAVIKVDVNVDRLVPVEFGDSDLVRVGERAIAIGNPFGLSSSMTVGIVSGLGRQLGSAELIDSTILRGFQNPKIIQVDTDINPGNSGGPLLNSHGQVIGVNTAIRTETGTFEGVGFAVPVNTVRRVVPELIDTGEVNYAWLGIQTVASDDGLKLAALAEPLKLPVNAGVLVTGVMPDSPASDAGLLGGTSWEQVRGNQICAGGDIIIAVDGEYIRDMDDLVSYLVVNTAPGDTINLRIVRDNETFDVPLTLGSRPTSGEFSDCGEE